MNVQRSDEELNERVEKAFLEVIESSAIDDLTSDEVTIVTARLASRFAEYAGDAANW